VDFLGGFWYGDFMPPPPKPITDEAAIDWLKQLPIGQFYVDVAEPFTPQIAPEGAWVFELDGKVFTIWPKKP
jgi:hypothetical protein